MANGITGNADSADDCVKDPAMQETPIADHLIISRDTQYDGVDGNKSTERSVRCVRTGEVFSENNVIESDDNHCSSPLIDKNKQKGNSIEPLSQLHSKFNRKTPDLDRIADFFRNNRTPRQKGLLAKFESSMTEDTPVSQRRDRFLLGPTSNKKSSSTEYVRRIVSNGEGSEGSSLIVTETDAQYTSEDLRGIAPSQRISHAPNKLGFLDQGTQSQKRSQSKELQRIKSLEGNHEIENLKMDHYYEQTEISSREKDVDISIENKSNHKDVYFGGSHINDTTNGDVSLQWVFKPNTNEQANSNNSTQLIVTGETQEDELNGKRGRVSSDMALADKIRAETVTSLTGQEKPMGNQACRLKSLVQAVESPEHTEDRSPQDLPSEPEDFDVGIFTEASRKSFSLESREIIDVESRSTSRGCDIPSSSRSIYEKQEDIERKEMLQISSEQGSLLNFDVVNEKQKNSDENASIIISETEYTQDLPELEEQSELTEGGSFRELTEESFEESEEIIKKTRKRNEKDRYTVAQEDGEEEGEGSNEEYGNHPKKRLRYSDTAHNFKVEIGMLDTHPRRDWKMQPSNEPSSRSEASSEGRLKKIKDFPEELKKEEQDFLSKIDVKFENAVWCQYNLNYCFYPGLLISYDGKADGYWVMFETGISLTKNDDIYYLDIRVGDAVNWHGRVHKVVALERRTQDPNIIRCIRGYDTVHLRKRNASGRLGGRHSIVPLSSISLDLKEWTKRPKIILEGGSHTRAKAFRFLQLPIRGRRSVSRLSSRRARIGSAITRKQMYREDSDAEPNDSITSDKSDTPESLYKLELPEGERKTLDSIDRGILRGCLFIFSGLSKNFSEEKYNLSDLIRSLGGTVLDAKFPDLFDFEFLVETDQQMKKYNLKLEWKSEMHAEKFRFACLLSSKHLRSLKYLEALALGWPILHWKFVEQCISDGKLCTDKIGQYLLPSGESFRLNPPGEQSGVIKSNDIFRFHLRLLENAPLRDQLGHNSFTLSDYMILVFAESELDQFLRFIFSCLGVRILFQIPGKIGTSATVPRMDILKEYTRNILRKEKNSKIIIYINVENGLSDEKLEEHKGRICNAVINDQTFPNFHVESKEWLIQTLINGSSGFD